MAITLRLLADFTYVWGLLLKNRRNLAMARAPRSGEVPLFWIVTFVEEAPEAMPVIKHDSAS